MFDIGFEYLILVGLSACAFVIVMVIWDLGVLLFGFGFVCFTFNFFFVLVIIVCFFFWFLLLDVSAFCRWLRLGGFPVHLVMILVSIILLVVITLISLFRVLAWVILRLFLIIG